MHLNLGLKYTHKRTSVCILYPPLILTRAVTQSQPKPVKTINEIIFKRDSNISKLLSYKPYSPVISSNSKINPGVSQGFVTLQSWQEWKAESSTSCMCVCVCVFVCNSLYSLLLVTQSHKLDYFASIFTCDLILVGNE